jgi:(E)-4-hydroxy-3-methylbut-2-enyl-diphosphate synthase
MDTVVAEIERRLEAYEDPVEVAVLGCAVNGIGEASHADFGITGAKNEGLVFSRGKPLRKVPQEELVDVLFQEIDKYATHKRIDVDHAEAAQGAEWLARIEAENAGEMTPERMAALERAAADGEEEDAQLLSAIKPTAGGDGAPEGVADATGDGAAAADTAPAPLDEELSPTAGRRFTRR